MHWRVLAGLVAISSLGAVASPQAVEEVIARANQARGGLDRLRAVQAVRMTGTMSIASQADAPVTHVDIFATAAKAAGAPPMSDRMIDGMDLVDLAGGGKSHRPLFWRSGHYRAVLDNGWKLQVSEIPPKTWLFDLNTDPNETKNLAEERPDKVRELTAVLEGLEAQMVPPLWPSLIDGPTAIVIARDGVWFGSVLTSAIARLDPETDAIDPVAIDGITGGMVVDANGDVWVAVRAQTV